MLLGKKGKINFKTKKVQKLLIVRRSALFLLVGVMLFSTFEPGLNYAAALIGVEKASKPNYSRAQVLDTKNQDKKITLNEKSVPIDLNPKIDRTPVEEITKLRTLNTTTHRNKDGSKTLEYSSVQRNFKTGNTWSKIDNSLKVEKTDSAVLMEGMSNVLLDKKPRPRSFSGGAGVISATMSPLSEGMTLKFDGKLLNVRPLDANDVYPVQVNEYTVLYENAWPNVDLKYELRGEIVKELIVVKDRSAQTSFDFKVSGGKLITHPTRIGELAIEGVDPDQFSFSSLTLDVNGRGVISEERVTQAPSKEGIRVTLDKKWLKQQPADAFPMIIDPSFYRYNDIGNVYKSDGYSCNHTNCNFNTGMLNDGAGWKAWRTEFTFDYGILANKRILDAEIEMPIKEGRNAAPETRNLFLTWAPCFGFHCVGSGPQAQGYANDTHGYIDITNVLQNVVDTSSSGAQLLLRGDEPGYKTYKPFYEMHINVLYDTPSPVSSPSKPENLETVIDTQPTLKGLPIVDADGASQYNFRVTTNTGKNPGAIINSGWINSPQWTVPEGILQDGTTYYWQIFTRDASNTSTVTESPGRSFKVNLRTGKDSTQSYDSVGPVGVDLATGNSSLGTTTHTMNALGGAMGLNFNYTTPNRAKKGLIGEYWNVASNYSFANGVPKTIGGNDKPGDIKRRDQNIDFNWTNGTPDSAIQADWYYVRWTGQFVAPRTGTFQFGGINDDNMRIWVSNNEMYNQGCYSNTTCYDTNRSIQLTAGQVVPLRVEYLEATGLATAQLFIKDAVRSEIVSNDMLYTNPVNQPLSYGLTGRYYTNTGDTNIDTAATDPSRLMMVRQDTKLNLNFGAGGPAQGLQTDNFMSRWTGYISVPDDGAYTLGAVVDDGVRIKLNNGFMGAQTTILDSWNPTGIGHRWGSSANLTASAPVPITIDYNEVTGGASFQLIVRMPNGSEVEVPASWLTAQSNVLPDQWNIGVDVDGSVGYERIRISSNAVILEDSTGSTHEYTWTGSGYKPPVNEDGQLTRNSDNTHTLYDVDGRTYIFNADGKLKSLTSPTDDRNPASLKYEYSGNPSRLTKITDGVTNSRFGTLHYKGINEDGNCSVASGFDAVPDGMLCAFKTSDGDVTKLHYRLGQLARVEKPGNDFTDYSYDTLGKITSIRDSIANDAIAANVRPNNTEVLSEVSYDTLGRANAVKAPAATIGASRINHTFEYLDRVTQMHVTGATEPHGFSKRVAYDDKLRTTTETNLANLSTTTVWDEVKDLQLSSTNPEGLRTTTIYDDDDRAIENYGPAPSGWFNSNRLPLPIYASQVPKTSTGYDEGLAGPAVNWHNVKGSSLVGAPKLLTHGIDQTEKNRFGRNFSINTAPFTVDSGMDGYGFAATAKVKFPATGKYTLKLYHDDGARLSIDDTSLVDDWAYRSEGTLQNLNTTTFDAIANKVYRLKLDYLHVGTPGALELWWAGPGITDTNNGLGTSKPGFVSPGYNLVTSQTGHDSLLGNVITKTNYSKPEYGLVDSTVLDPTGLNLQTTATYEAPATGYLRQTSKTLPGGGTTVYQHYPATGSESIKDNPCTPEVESFHQAGFSKGKTEADPDGAGPQTGRTTESVYNNSGQIVATRYNNDPWTCTEYDSRDRVTRTVIPQLSQYQPSQTIINNYATDNNPLIITTSDSNGAIRVENDLLERIFKYTDAKGNLTTNSYDSYGKITQRISPVGTESYVYDQYDRLISQKLDNITYAQVAYDQYGRVDNVTYPAAGSQKVQYTRDTLGRTNRSSYTLSANDPNSNIIDNPSVEQNSGSAVLPTSWTDGSYGDNTRSLSYENNGNVGNRSLKISLSSYTDGDAKWAHAPVEVKGGGSYTYSDYSKSDVTTKFVAKFTNQDNTETYAYLGDKASSDTWTQASFAFNAPTTSKNVIVFHVIDKVGTLHIDDVDLRLTSANNQGQTSITDELRYSTSGDVISGTENGISKSYTYDNAGRLTNATIGSNTFAYEFGASATECGSMPGNNQNAGRNGNRSKLTTNGVVTTYCYDHADRLIGSSDSNFNNVEYDAHGNTTRLNETLHPVYDASDRNRGIEQYDGSGNGKAVYYDRDAQDRIIGRSTNSITNWSWQGTGTVHYGYSSGSDAPDFVQNTSGVVTEKYVTLPGDIIMTVRPSEVDVLKKTTYSITNIHDDNFAITNAAGQLVSTHATGPFGEHITTQTIPNNTITGTTWGYLGQNEKLTETDFNIPGGIIQMGARAYIPGLGRFLSVDSVEGGTDNNYVYANDPVNQKDLDGRAVPAIPALIAAIVFCVKACPAMLKSLNVALKSAQAAEKARKSAAARKAVQEALKQAIKKVEYNALKNIRNNPKLGHQIMKGKINDPRYREAAGWRKMEYTLRQNGRQATVHYFYNVKTKALDQIKIKFSS
jgi:RHS repeat-associated protein